MSGFTRTARCDISNEMFERIERIEERLGTKREQTVRSLLFRAIEDVESGIARGDTILLAPTNQRSLFRIKLEKKETRD